MVLHLRGHAEVALEWRHWELRCYRLDSRAPKPIMPMILAMPKPRLWQPTDAVVSDPAPVAAVVPRAIPRSLPSRRRLLPPRPPGEHIDVHPFVLGADAGERDRPGDAVRPAELVQQPE